MRGHDKVGANLHSNTTDTPESTRLLTMAVRSGTIVRFPLEWHQIPHQPTEHDEAPAPNRDGRFVDVYSMARLRRVEGRVGE